MVGVYIVLYMDRTTRRLSIYRFESNACVENEFDGLNNNNNNKETIVN